MSSASAPTAPPVTNRVSSIRSLQRQLATLMPEAGVVGATDGGPSLEVASVTDLPRLIGATVIEGDTLRARVVPLENSPGFSAFLDGKQESRVVLYADGIPLIHGTVGAVIRQRANRRMGTWHHEVSEQLYAPRRMLSPEWNAALDALAVDVVDTSPGDGSSSAAAEHPFAVRDAAIHRVQEDRERAEHRLAERWCASAGGPLFVDGGISANERVATSEHVAGVVKGHRTLYAEGRDLRVIFGLGAGERSSVFRITSPKRTTVASWYLRLRDPTGRDPMWGLVRVEAAHPTAETKRELSERADRLSRWILGEVSPLALPDSRWDTMVYGIRDCEEFLRAVM